MFFGGNIGEPETLGFDPAILEGSCGFSLVYPRRPEGKLLRKEVRKTHAKVPFGKSSTNG